MSARSDKDVLDRLMRVCQMEGVSYDPRGLEALVFTADGDMRQALNNLQSTHRWGPAMAVTRQWSAGKRVPACAVDNS